MSERMIPSAIVPTPPIGDGPQEAWVVSLDGSRSRKLNDFRWAGRHYPFDVDPRTGGLLTTDHVGGKAAIWLAEYE